jgi:hypothetical protein
MPRKDRTGPQGKGPMTGRGRGKCKPKDKDAVRLGPGDKAFGRKLGRGRRQGPGRGVNRSTGRVAGQGRGR